MPTKAKIYYFSLPDEMRKEEKLAQIASTPFAKVPFERITPDEKANWINLTDNDFDDLIPLCAKDKQQKTIFEFASLGVSTNRDAWVYDFDRENLSQKMNFFIQKYNALLEKKDTSWNTEIKWSEYLKGIFKRQQILNFDESLIIEANYRPFTKQFYYAEKMLSDRLTQNHYDIFGENLDEKNSLIGFLSGYRLDFCVIATNLIPNLATFSLDPAKWVPLYRYENGERKENITDWALEEFRNRYQGGVGSQGAGNREQGNSPNLNPQPLNPNPYSPTPNPPISKTDIFHYVYAVLHNPAYRSKYEQNLKRDFPRIPLYENFWQWAAWGKALMELHLNYETVEKYPLVRDERLGGRGQGIGGRGQGLGVGQEANIVFTSQTDTKNDKNIQGLDNLAASDGLSNTNLSTHAPLSERGNLWSDKPNEEGSRFDSLEHSRGASTEQHPAIPTIPLDSEGFVSGTGNASDNFATADLSKSATNTDDTQPNSEHRQAHQRIDEGSTSKKTINALTPNPYAPTPVFAPKAKLKADKTTGEILIDEVTTLKGVPPQAWDYKLGNRSALEWVLDQYKEKKPSDPTIAEKFNTYRFADHKEQVIDLLQRLCTLSLETVRIVEEMGG